MEIDEQHAAGEARDRLGDPLLRACVRGLRAAALLKCKDVALERAVEAARFRRRDRRAEAVPGRFRYLF
jgi:hypothetical protein